MPIYPKEFFDRTTTVPEKPGTCFVRMPLGEPWVFPHKGAVVAKLLLTVGRVIYPESGMAERRH